MYSSNKSSFSLTIRYCHNWNTGYCWKTQWKSTKLKRLFLLNEKYRDILWCHFYKAILHRRINFHVTLRVSFWEIIWVFSQGLQGLLLQGFCTHILEHDSSAVMKITLQIWFSLEVQSHNCTAFKAWGKGFGSFEMLKTIDKEENTPE